MADTNTNIAEFKAQVLRLGKEMPANLVRTRVRLAGLAMIAQLVTSTPVATGRLRGEWQTTIGQPANSPIGRTDKSGEQAKSQASSVIASLPDYPVLWFSNAMPYAITVDQGGYVPPDPENSPAANKARAARRTASEKSRAADVSSKHGGPKDPGAPLVRGGFSIQAPAGMTLLAVEVGRQELTRV